MSMFVLSPSPVCGQSNTLTGSKGPTHSSQLPDWAESTSPSESESTTPSENTPPPEQRTDDEMRTKAPPPGEEPVPVDGGVALLAAVGAGYAVRKLNQEEEEDEGPA